jgi:hypothetical protein
MFRCIVLSGFRQLKPRAHLYCAQEGTQRSILVRCDLSRDVDLMLVCFRDVF